MAAEKFANQAYLSVTESGANTLTFSKLETGVSIYEKVGWLISRIDYFFGLSVANFGATADAIRFGITVSDVIASMLPGMSSVVDLNMITRTDLGTAGSGMFTREPFIKDFSNLLGGGLLVPPNPIYIGAQGTTLTSAMTISARLFYSVVHLKTEEFWELVEQRRMIGT